MAILQLHRAQDYCFHSSKLIVNGHLLMLIDEIQKVLLQRQIPSNTDISSLAWNFNGVYLSLGKALAESS